MEDLNQGEKNKKLEANDKEIKKIVRGGLNGKNLAINKVNK